MGFNFMDLMSEESKRFNIDDSADEIVFLPVDKLKPTSKNFYSIEDDRVRKLAASIEMLSSEDKLGIQQNLVVRKIEDSEEYEIVSGETRWQAVNLLLSEGRTKITEVPCKVESGSDPVRDELILILTNSTQRVRSDAEKMKEIDRLRELLQEYKKSNKLGGTMQQAIADILGVSKTKVGTLDNINRHLIQELKQDYEQGMISTAVANKLAGIDEELQIAARDLLYEKGSLHTIDVDGLIMNKHFQNKANNSDQKDDVEDSADMPKENTDDSAPGNMSISFSVDSTEDEVKEDDISFSMPMPEVEEEEEDLSEYLSDQVKDSCRRSDAFVFYRDLIGQKERDLINSGNLLEAKNIIAADRWGRYGTGSWTQNIHVDTMRQGKLRFIHEKYHYEYEVTITQLLKAIYEIIEKSPMLRIEEKQKKGAGKDINNLVSLAGENIQASKEAVEDLISKYEIRLSLFERDESANEKAEINTRVIYDALVLYKSELDKRLGGNTTCSD